MECFYSTFLSFAVHCLLFKMLVAVKRKYNHKSLREKCQALKDLEKRMSNKDVAAKYNVPKTCQHGLKTKKNF